MKYQKILAWVFAFIFMAGVAAYQRYTGPTYPKRGSTELNGTTIDFKLNRSFGGPGDADIRVETEDMSIEGELKFRRYKSHDEWTTVDMKREGNELVAYLPHLPPAGKMIYEVFLQKGSEKVMLSNEPVILRFKGSVPDFILIPHIIFMFLAMVFSTRAAISGIFKWDDTFTLSKWTTIFFMVGGLVLGPMVQYYAFGFLWTGWPLADGTLNLFKFGDLTDNKTLTGIVIWIIALWQMRRNRNAKYWAIIAAVVLLAVYLIPHSLLGSEIDFREIDPHPSQIQGN